MFDIFGETMPLPVKFFIAFAVVLALIGLTAFIVRRFGANRLGGAAARGRQPRLAVIDAAPVDGRRRLVLIRRDNVEHLLMIGGTTDVVVEQNIVRGTSNSSTREPARNEPPVREPSMRESQVREPAPREPSRSTLQVDNGWPLQPASDPAPVIPTRPSRATEEPWTPPEPGARARPADSNSLASMAADLSSRLTPPEVPAPVAVRPEPPVARPAPQPPQAPAYVAPEPVAIAPQDDNNLAEMAQQLEAALRRAPAPAPESRPPVTDALAAQPKSPVPTRDYKLRLDPKFESKLEAKPETKPEPKLDVRAEPRFDAPEPRASASRAPEPRIEPRVAAPAAPAEKNVFDNLEEEMASLLGRPSGKT